MLARRTHLCTRTPHRRDLHGRQDLRDRFAMYHVKRILQPLLMREARRDGKKSARTVGPLVGAGNTRAAGTQASHKAYHAHLRQHPPPAGAHQLWRRRPSCARRRPPSYCRRCPPLVIRGRRGGCGGVRLEGAVQCRSPAGSARGACCGAPRGCRRSHADGERAIRSVVKGFPMGGCGWGVPRA